MNSRLCLPTCIMLFLVFAPGVLWALETEPLDTGTLTASLDQESVPVGGVVWLTLEYRLPAGGRLPEKPEIQGLEGLSVLKQMISPQQIRIQLLVDHLGPWQSEPIRLGYVDSKGQPQLLTAPPVSIQATSNLSAESEETQLRPIRDIVSVKSIWQTYRIWLAAMAAVVLIGLGLFWWHKRRQAPHAVDAYTAPPDVRARKALRELEAKRYFEKGLEKKYYYAFSEILRRYLESIRNFPAAEFTTEEIAKHIAAAQDRQLIPLLQQADLVKFADTVPTQARKEEDVKAALAYIRETSPQREISQETAHQREVRP